MIAICNWCGGEYRTHPSWLHRRNGGEGGYCSRICHGRARQARIIEAATPRQCPICGTWFGPYGPRFGTGAKYCSQKCSGIARMRPERNIRLCQTCGTPFKIAGSSYRPGQGKFCSRACYGLAQRGPRKEERK